MEKVPSKKAEEFFENNTPYRKIGGVSFYLIKQVANTIGTSTSTIRRWIKSGKLEEIVGVSHQRDPISNYRIFSEDFIRKLYENFMSAYSSPEQETNQQ